MTPEDDLFRRVLLHNKLVSEEQLVDAMAELMAMGADEDAPPPPTLGQHLVDKAVISEPIKQAVEKALAGHLSEEYAPPGASQVPVHSSDEPADGDEAPDEIEEAPPPLADDELSGAPSPEPIGGPDPVPAEDAPPDASEDLARVQPIALDPEPEGEKPEDKASGSARSAGAREIMKRRQWKPRSKRMAEAMRRSDRTRRDDDDEEPEEEEEAEGQGSDSATAAPEDKFDRFIRHVVPSRLHQRFLQYCVENSVSVFGEQDLTRAIGIQPKRAGEICKLWLVAGIIRRLGEGTYNFAPGARLRAEIDDFLAAWRSPKRRRDLLSKIVAEERD